MLQQPPAEPIRQLIEVKGDSSLEELIEVKWDGSLTVLMKRD